MNPIKVIIVDDEPLAHSVIMNYIEKVTFLDPAGNFYNVVDAIEFLSSNDIDLIFLDIQMPDITGIEWVKNMANPPKIILTTAFSEFALEAFDLGITDYLVKPIRFDRFMKAVQKVTIKLNFDEPAEENFTFVKHNNQYVKVDYSKLNFIEAYGNFLKLHIINNQYIITDSLVQFLKNAPQGMFIRVHKSFAVNIRSVDKLSGNVLYINQNQIPIGSAFKKAVLEALKIKQ